MHQQPLYVRLGLIGALAVLLLASAALAAGEQIPRSAITSGGGAAEVSEASLRASIGQPVACTISGALRLCSGLHCGAGAPDTPDPEPDPDERVYLPLLTR